ncbi:uncharacterized protein LOC111261631 isoform X2 [Varroa jacobsoni]|uniref:uncharacterized protein LOC111261631 isoform X2 n=1 Tax=Varroa jacobsoni TaxID=62625 RepID=UPI000BFA4E7B|nr:uncharacterized protein LOC111261631 isoform X2 [Varroa jacobsoni]
MFPYRRVNDAQRQYRIAAPVRCVDIAVNRRISGTIIRCRGEIYFNILQAKKAIRLLCLAANNTVMALTQLCRASKYDRALQESVRSRSCTRSHRLHFVATASSSIGQNDT